MNFKKVLITAFAFTLAATAAGCGKSDSEEKAPADTSAAPKAAQEIKINMSADPPALDVSKATANASFTIIAAVNEGLYRLDKDLKATPGLAKEMPKVSADGLTYTITLKDNLTYADGTPLKAQDFVYSYLRTLNPATKAQYSFFLEWIKGGKELHAAKDQAEFDSLKKNFGVVAKDDKTLEITLTQPKGFFTELLAFCTFFPQSEAFVTKQGEKNGADAPNVLGAGPFKLQSWDHEQKLVLVKNDKYWDAANVKLSKVTVNVVKDPQTGVNLFESKEADLTLLRGDTVSMYNGKPEYTIKKELTNSYVQFQTKKFPAFNNTKIRQALSMAIDRKPLVDTILKNGSTPSTGFVPNGTLDGNGGDFRKAAGDTQPAFDAAKAKTLLAEGLKELNMTALPKFSLMADDSDAGKKTIEYILAQWKQNLGVEATSQPVPHELRVDKQHKHDFEALLALWGADYNDPMTFLDMWITGGEFNDNDWSNAEYDALVKGADKESDRAKRAKMLVDAEKILMKELPVSTLYFRNQVYAKRTNIDGLILPPYGQEWELKWTSVK
ncbi:peptide ABC transporter substrate-binding protein [Gorillibacterium sp. sgz5001074]|uniref:peptide ABC transporter substrate-binding protein n=1 Tax=Gorillibacterium sp. sgz5001074 TaxID=3446695 RepID=UPI003F662219